MNLRLRYFLVLTTCCVNLVFAQINHSHDNSNGYTIKRERIPSQKQNTKSQSKSSDKSQSQKQSVTSSNAAQNPNSSDFNKPKDLDFTVNGVTFTMVYVEGGTFTMGATEEQSDGAFDYELPTHQVTLSSYYIGKYEVTQELWLSVMRDNPSHFKDDIQYPVECVTWDDCQTFISRLNQITGRHFSLPTEAEWEFAARGGNQSHGYIYSGSNLHDYVAWNMNNSSNTTHRVGTKAPNELGLYDMTGNVMEWCQDRFSMYMSYPQTNPTGGDTDPNRMVRGGCWKFDGRGNRISMRLPVGPLNSMEIFGFRLALR